MKLTFTLIALLSALTVSAQLQKGDLVVDVGQGGPLFNGRLGHFVTGNLGSLTVWTIEEDRTNSLLSVGASPYYLVNQRLAVGGQAGISFFYDPLDGFDARVYLAPQARYYFVNRSSLLAYGGIGVGALRLSSREGLELDVLPVSLSVGAQLPLSKDILLGAALSYSFDEEMDSPLFLGTGIEIVLNADDRPEAPLPATFERGDLMFSAQSLGFAIHGDYASGNLGAGVDYFLSDRFSLGIGLGAGLSRSTNTFTDTLTAVTRTFTSDRSSWEVGIGMSARYYFAHSRRVAWYGELGITYTYSRNNRTLTIVPPPSRVDDERIIQNVHLVPILRGGAQWFLREHVFLSAGPYLDYRLIDRTAFDDFVTESDGRWFAGLHFGLGVVL